MVAIPAVAAEEYRRATVRLQAAAVAADSAAVVTEVVDLPRLTEHPVEVAVAADTPAVGHRPPATEHRRPPATEHPRHQATGPRPAAAAAAVSEVVALAVVRPPAATEPPLRAAMEHLVPAEVSAAGHRPPATEPHLDPPAATGHRP